MATGARINWYDIAGDDQLTLTGRTLNELRAGGNLTDNAWDNPFAAGTENITTQRYETGIGYSKTFASSDKLAVNLGYCLHKRNATNDSFLGDYEETHPDDTTTADFDESVASVDIMRPYKADELIFIADVNYAKALGKHYLLAGVQYSRNQLEESGEYCIVDEADTANYGKTYLSTSEKHADEIGIYLQGEISLRDNLELLLGGRGDIHKSKDQFAGSGDISISGIELEYDETCFNPRAAIRFNPSSKLTLRTSAGTGFRIPYGFSEDLHLCSGSPRVYKGSGLRPEKAVSFNLGADYKEKNYGLGISLFRTNLKDKIDFADAGPTAEALNYTYEWRNIGDAYTQGIEFGLKLNPLSVLDFDLNLTYTDAQYNDKRSDWVDNHPEFADDSKYIPRVPHITGGLELAYSPGTWNLVLQNIYTGKMYIDYCKDEDIGNPYSKIKHTNGFVVVNTKVSKSFPSAGLTLFVGAKNLTDYIQPEKHSDDAAFMWAPYTGRLIYGGMEVML